MLCGSNTHRKFGKFKRLPTTRKLQYGVVDSRIQSHTLRWFRVRRRVLGHLRKNRARPGIPLHASVCVIVNAGVWEKWSQTDPRRRPGKLECASIAQGKRLRMLSLGVLRVSLRKGMSITIRVSVHRRRPRPPPRPPLRDVTSQHVINRRVCQLYILNRLITS